MLQQHKTLDKDEQQFLWFSDRSPNTHTLISVWSCPTDTSFGATNTFPVGKKFLQRDVSLSLMKQTVGCAKTNLALAEPRETGCTAQPLLMKAQGEHIHTVDILEVIQTEECLSPSFNDDIKE